MNLKTNIPTDPPIQFNRGGYGAPAIELNTDMAKYKNPDGTTRYDQATVAKVKAWVDAWLAEPNIRVVMTDDRTVCLAADGATLRMRGEKNDEHRWLAGWVGRRVKVTQRGEMIVFEATAPLGQKSEGESIVTPSAVTPARYDLMTKAQLATECIARGFGGQQAGEDLLVGAGTDARSVPKTRLVQWLREDDARRAKVDHTFVEVGS